MFDVLTLLEEGFHEYEGVLKVKIMLTINENV
jgi:hypothetical protein